MTVQLQIRHEAILYHRGEYNNAHFRDSGIQWGCLQFSTIALEVMLLVSKETISLPCKLTPVTCRRVQVIYLFISFFWHATRVEQSSPARTPGLHYRPILSLFSRYACESDNTGGWWLDAGVKLGIGDRWCSLRPSVRSHCPFHSGRGSHRTPGSIRLLWWLHAWGYSIACWCG